MKKNPLFNVFLSTIGKLVMEKKMSSMPVEETAVAVEAAFAKFGKYFADLTRIGGKAVKENADDVADIIVASIKLKDKVVKSSSEEVAAAIKEVGEAPEEIEAAVKAWSDWLPKS